MTSLRAWVVSLAVAAALGAAAGCGGPAPRSCNAGNCTGCCSAEDQCEEGKVSEACGSGGRLCASCSAEQVCAASVCSSVGDGGVPVACDPPCAAGKVCDLDTCVDACRQRSCTGGKICNFNSGLCETARPCSTMAQQPDACSYGQFCSGTSCGEVVAPSAGCAAFATTSHARSWGTGSAGAVVYSVTKELIDPTSTFCNQNMMFTRVKVLVKAYDPAAGFPASDGSSKVAIEGLDEASVKEQFHFVDPAGNEMTDKPKVQGLSTSADKKHAEFYVNFCVMGANVTSYYAALHHAVGAATGNEACSNIQ